MQTRRRNKRCEFYSLETNLCRRREFGDGTLYFLVMSHRYDLNKFPE